MSPRSLLHLHEHLIQTPSECYPINPSPHRTLKSFGFETFRHNGNH